MVELYVEIAVFPKELLKQNCLICQASNEQYYICLKGESFNYTRYKIRMRNKIKMFLLGRNMASYSKDDIFIKSEEEDPLAIPTIKSEPLVYSSDCEEQQQQFEQDPLACVSVKCEPVEIKQEIQESEIKHDPEESNFPFEEIDIKMEQQSAASVPTTAAAGVPSASACQSMYVKLNDNIPLTNGEKTIIWNVFNKFRERYPEFPKSDIVEITSEFTGVSAKSIVCSQKEKPPVKVESPKKRKRTKSILWRATKL
ncbi:hypothetical protein C0J52_12612 [Blattella germanica]|nr:hypothetical protein C0J52_12612 [Blattella germanica]